MLNKIIQGDNVSVMKELASGSIDLTVTSPPYDNLRKYKGYSFNFEDVANQLYRITKKGGVVVWVVGDATVKGSETGSSFRQALHFMDIGFRLHDTMIYKKNSYPFPPSNRYYQQFEYMFVFSKGAPTTKNLLRQKSKWGNATSASTTRDKDGSTKSLKYEINKKTRIRDNVWEINTGYMKTTKDKFAYEHPAMFPEQLAEDHILTWSNQDDVVLDPFVGSGTTSKMAILNNRNYIGIDISEEYCELARKRINETKKGI